MQCAFVDVGIQKILLPLSDINLVNPQVDDEDDGEESQPPVSITDIPVGGDSVQIIKEPIGSKGARGTTYLTFQEGIWF